MWKHHLTAKLLEIGFTQSLIDDCVFYRGDTIFIVYVDDGIFIGDNDNQIMAIISQLQGLGLKIEDQGHPADYIGVNIKGFKGDGIEFTQQALIDSIIGNKGYYYQTSACQGKQNAACSQGPTNVCTEF